MSNSGRQLNKLAAGILVAALLAMVVGTITNAIYKPNLKAGKRGYEVAVHSSDAAEPQQAVEEVIDVAKLMASANAEAGKDSAKKCLSCHSLGKGEPNKVGPNLWNVVNRAKGVEEGYKYSAAMLAKGGNWDEDSLLHFLHKPNKYLPGTKMSFVGFKAEDAANVVAYLKSLKD